MRPCGTMREGVDQRRIGIHIDLRHILLLSACSLADMRSTLGCLIVVKNSYKLVKPVLPVWLPLLAHYVSSETYMYWHGHGWRRRGHVPHIRLCTRNNTVLTTRSSIATKHGMC